MKIFKLIITLLIAFSLMISSYACSAGATGGFNTGGGSSMDGAGADSGEGSGSSSGDSSDSGNGSGNTDITKPSGLITAAAWNDNDNYLYWQDLFSQDASAPGKFYNYYGVNSWGFNSYNRIKVTVKNGENVVAGASVVAYNQENTAVYKAVSNANGVAYLFCDDDVGTITATSGESSSTVEFTAEQRDLTVELTSNADKMNVVELMFVVDVTGSMGDEISFLKNEIADVVNKISASDNQVQIKLALLFYRDRGDAENLIYFDFEDVTTPEGLQKQQNAIRTQSATGGGDFPEYVDEALELAVSKSWSDTATTKIIFHLLDAPPHSTDSDKVRFNTATLKASELGIRYCPILSSGADTLTEYVTRQAALHTGGTFVFITDDSGIGNSHHDPNLPNVTVEALNSLMVRLVKGYHTGVFAEAIDWRYDTEK